MTDHEDRITALDPEYCPFSQRVDGQKHTWRWDGDSPRIICCWCDEMRHALVPDWVITPGRKPDRSRQEGQG